MGKILAIGALVTALLPAGQAHAAAPSSCSRTDAGYRCMYGPVDVPANREVRITDGVAAPSEAGYITSARATLVDSEGHKIPHHMVHLHHAVWLNPMKRDMTCGQYDSGLPNYDRFFASGKERTPLQMPAGYGYYWSNQMPNDYTGSSPFWVLVAHLDGMMGESDTYIQLDLGFTPVSEASDITDVKPVWLDEVNCSSDPVFTVKKGSGRGGLFTKRWNYTMPEGGRFVSMAGHLHDGGLRLGLDDRTTGTRIFMSRATYGMHHEPWYLTKMGSFSEVPGRPVDAGDELRLSATYDSTHTWKDVMGIMLGMLAPE